MAGLVLEAEERARLLRMMRRQTNSHVHRRMNVLLLDDGWRSERIAEALSIDAETVREHRRRHESSGVAWPARQRGGVRGNAVGHAG